MDFKKIILGLITVTLLSCGTVDISPMRLFVKEIEDPTCYKDLFEYGGGHLITFKRFFGEREETTTQFHYLDKQLVKIEIKRDQGLEHTIELTYGENGLRQEEKLTTIYSGEITYIKTGTFSYKNGVLKSVIYSYNDPNYLSAETEFQWSNGNITKMDFYFFDSYGRHHTGNRIYTYDNKINYSNQDTAFIYTVGTGDETKISKNNLIATIENFGNESFQGGQYSFTYNVSGYPTGYRYEINNQKYNPIQIKY